MLVEIVPVTDGGSLPTCTPSLMPFHMSYTGHAPVSLYFRPRPAPPSSAAVSVQSSSTTTLVASLSSTSMLNETKGSLTALSSAASVGSLAQGSECEEHPKTGSSTTAIGQVDQVMATRLLVDTDTIEMDQGTQPALSAVPLKNSSRLTPRKVDRFVAAFRGRQMYGQAVDIPDGFGGLVLRAPIDPKGKDTEDAKPSSKPLSQKAKLRLKARVTMRRSNCAVADDAADGPGGGDDEDCSPDSGVDPSFVTRTLIPCSTFASFMLWTPDRPLDEGNDEYVRALVEWTRLAAEIHSYDE